MQTHEGRARETGRQRVREIERVEASLMEVSSNEPFEKCSLKRTVQIIYASSSNMCLDSEEFQA